MKMNKYMTVAAALLAAATFTSCENDEIEISSSVNIVVNPYTVVSPFDGYAGVYEDNLKDELMDLSASAAVLHIHVLAYNSDGNLAAEQDLALTGGDKTYATKRNVELFLSPGEYTLVGLSYIYHNKQDFYMWKPENTAKLSTLTIEDGGYIWRQNKMLGLKAQKVTVDENTESINLNLEPMGCIIETLYMGLENFESYVYPEVLKEIKFATNKKSGSLAFNSNADVVVNEEIASGSTSWYNIDFVDYDNGPDYFANMAFYIPTTSAKFWFVVESEKYYWDVSDTQTLSLRKGQAYLALLWHQGDDGILAGVLDVDRNGKENPLKAKKAEGSFEVKPFVPRPYPVCQEAKTAKQSLRVADFVVE